MNRWRSFILVFGIIAQICLAIGEIATHDDLYALGAAFAGLFAILLTAPGE